MVGSILTFIFFLFFYIKVGTPISSSFFFDYI
nr:MAG TPA: hypothetical protein [Caudoviricetes sp.]